MRIRTSILAASAALMLQGTLAAAAQTNFPTRTIEINVGFAAGGAVDLATRAIAPFLEKHLGGGASVVVINRPGAAGAVAAIQTANANPDGHTMLMLSYPALVTSLYGTENQPYELEGFEFLGNVTSDPHNFFVNADSPFQTLEDLMNAAREQPGVLNVNAADAGGAAHLALLVFEGETDLSFNFVPSDGGAGTVTQVLGGHVDVGITTLSLLASYVEEGQLRMLASFSPERNPILPDAPTAREQGVDVLWGALRGFAAPAGLPDEVREKLADAIEAAMYDPEFIALAERQGIPLMYLSGEEFREIVDTDVERLDQLWERSPWVEQ